jgi:hypothetical protein
MKRLFVLLSALLFALNSFANDPVKIDDHLLKTFAVQFPHAQEVVWKELNEAYIVSFIEDGIRLKVTYLRNGEITHFLRYYLEENMPLDIRLNIKKKYPGKEIYGIVEENIVSNIENRSRTVYYITLEDNTGWIRIKAERHKKFKLIEKLVKQI